MRKSARGGWAVDVPDGLQIPEVPGIRYDGRVARGDIGACAAVASSLGLDVVEGITAPNHTAALAGDLRQYQVIGVDVVLDFLMRSGGAILADDMGLGKTRQAAVVAQHLAGLTGRVLVICPASVRESWRAELGRLGWGGAILGPPSNKKYVEAWERAPRASWIVTSYELAERAFEAAFPDTTPRVVIFDEAHLLRGRDAKRAERAMNIARMSTYRLALTGTPLWSRPRDMYKLLNILHGSATWGTWFKFDKRYCGGKFDEWGGWDNKGLTNAEELRLRLGYYMVRRTRQEVASELPAFTRQIVWVDAEQRAVEYFKQAMLRRRGGDTHKALEATLDAKIPAVVELAKQAQGKYLVLTWLKKHAAKLHKLLPNSVCITGEVSHAERAERIRIAARDNLGVVATIDSVGTGVDGLQHVAHVGITHAIDYVPVKLMQAEGRLNRIGQTQPIVWYYVAMSETMDQLVVESVVEKLAQFGQVMGADEGLGADLGTDVNGASDEDALAALYGSMSNDEVEDNE